MEQRIVNTREQIEGVSSYIGYLLGRLEFARRELMFEMRYHTSSPSQEPDQIKG